MRSNWKCRCKLVKVSIFSCFTCSVVHILTFICSSGTIPTESPMHKLTHYRLVSRLKSLCVHVRLQKLLCMQMSAVRYSSIYRPRWKLPCHRVSFECTYKPVIYRRITACHLHKTLYEVIIVVSYML